MLAICLLLVEVLGEFRVPITQTDKHKEVLEAGIKKFAPKLEIVPCDKGNCATATEDIVTMEPFISLPVWGVLTTLDKTPLIRSDVKEEFTVVFNLLYYKFMDKSNSFLSSAINSFPIEFDVPANWTDADTEFYKKLNLFKQEVGVVSFYKEMHEFFVANYERSKYPESLFELESWKWAELICQTRSFGIDLESFHEAGAYLNVNGNKELRVILPIVDLLNHSLYNKMERPRTFLYKPNPPTIVYHAMRDFNKGGEVFNWYNRHNSFAFMNLYGFVIRGNVDDILKVSLGNFAYCRGTLKDKLCNYELSVTDLNREFLITFTDLKTEMAPTDSLFEALDALVDRNVLGDVEPEEFDLLVYGSHRYRHYLISLYNVSDAVSFRDLRRTYSKQDSYRRRMIFEYAEIERTIQFECLKIIDRALMYLLHSSLFI